MHNLQRHIQNLSAFLQETLANADVVFSHSVNVECKLRLIKAVVGSGTCDQARCALVEPVEQSMLDFRVPCNSKAMAHLLLNPLL